MEQELPKPLVSDAKIAQYASQYVQPNAREVKRACEHVRNLYEPELQRLRAQVEAMRVADIEEVRKAFGFIKEIGERDHHLTWKHDVDQMVKWANHGLASVPQQDVGAGRSAPSPVGQEPTMEQVREVVKAWILDNFDIEIEEHTLGSHNLQERLSALFTHPPKAGVLSALKAGDPTS